MKVLLDHNVPHGLRPMLHGHDVVTVRFRGWSELRNGDLLRAAAQKFDALLTLDRTMRYEQHIASFDLATRGACPKKSHRRD